MNKDMTLNIPLDKTVAYAAPAIPRSSTKIKIGSKMIFSRTDKPLKIIGVRVSPSPCLIPLKAKVINMVGAPKNMILR